MCIRFFYPMGKPTLGSWRGPWPTGHIRFFFIRLAGAPKNLMWPDLVLGTGDWGAVGCGIGGLRGRSLRHVRPPGTWLLRPPWPFKIATTQLTHKMQKPPGGTLPETSWRSRRRSVSSPNRANCIAQKCMSGCVRPLIYCESRWGKAGILACPVGNGPHRSRYGGGENKLRICQKMHKYI